MFKNCKLMNQEPHFYKRIFMLSIMVITIKINV